MSKTTKIGQVASALSVVQLARGLYKDGVAVYNNKKMYTVSIDQDNVMYMSMMKWLNDNVHPRRFKLFTDYYNHFRMYDASGEISFVLNGERIRVNLAKPEKNAGDAALSAMGMGGASSKEVLEFTCYSPNGVDQIDKLVKDLRTKAMSRKQKIAVLQLDAWNQWVSERMSYRSLESIFLPEGEKESVLGAIDDFRASGSKYKKLGFPWHFGLMLYGQPGNGKSSMVLGLANHYQMNVYNLPLSGVKSDKVLAGAVASIPPNSILLIEDIDVFSHVMGREQVNPDLTLAGVMNALDGISTPSGLLTIITTNHPEVLDEALTRPGRMDYRLELTSPDDYQVASMYEEIFEEPLGITDLKEFNSMAAVAEVFKRNLDDSEAVRLELKR